METVINDVVPVERKNGNKVLNLAGRKGRRIMTGLAAAAACLMVAATSVFTWNQQTFGSVYMTINPEVRIDVNRKNVVVGVDEKSDNDSEHSFDNGDLDDGDSGYDDAGEEDIYDETEEEVGGSGYDETFFLRWKSRRKRLPEEISVKTMGSCISRIINL